MSAPKYMTFTAAAARLGVSYWTVYREIRAGRLTPVVVNKRQFLAESELRRYLKLKPGQAWPEFPPRGLVRRVASAKR